MPIYKNHEYFKDKDSLWKVIVNGSIIIVALDDSKINGNRRIIDSRNNERACKEYIDWFIK